jgi:hypothetical protein
VSHDHDYVRRLIAARAPELSERDLDLIGEPPDPDAIPGHIALQIMEVLDQMSDRLDRYEAKFAEAEPVPARLH